MADRIARVPAAAGPEQESVWDYPRPPRVEPSSERVVGPFKGDQGTEGW